MWPFKFAMQRRRKRGLPHMILYLLSSSPKNGVELMEGVQSITRGWWRPTPGSIYPLLKEMSDQGIVKKREDGRYELTAKGRSEVKGGFGPPMHRRPRTPGDMLSQMHGFVSYMEEVKSSDSGQLEPHRSRMRELAKRLEDLAGQDDSESGSKS